MTLFKQANARNKINETAQYFRYNKIAKLLLRWIVLLALFAYLAHKLSRIGWSSIVQSLPSSPLFYSLSVAFVFLPVITEKIVFHMAASKKASPPFKIFIRKHMMNKAIMNYAGEGYFIQKISNVKGNDLRGAAIIVKNLNLIRTFTANFWVVFLALAAIALGSSDVLQKILNVSPLLVLAVSALCIGVCSAGIIFFRKLTRLKAGLAAKIAFVYLLRSVLAGCILIAQWNLVLPGTALAVWFQFLVVYFITKKSPIAEDLVFVSVALTLPGLGGDNATIAAMFLVMAAVSQLIYSLGFVFTSEFTERKAAISY